MEENIQKEVLSSEAQASEVIAEKEVLSDAVAPEQTENTCVPCAGKGRLSDAEICSTCEGTGK